MKQLPPSDDDGSPGGRRERRCVRRVPGPNANEYRPENSDYNINVAWQVREWPASNNLNE